jgi:tRNA pseudouridine55 synthase
LILDSRHYPPTPLMHPAPSGILLLNKPSGVSSFAALYPVKRAFGGKKGAKIGHAGTLDPAASGLLVIGVGSGTRLLEYLEGLPKQYTFTLKLGVETDTYDLEGTVLERRDASGVTREAVEALLPRFRGEILQAPPAYSAIKVDGKRAYDLARAGEVVELAARKVRVDRLEITSFSPGEAAMVLDCSKGTYVRSVAHDLGRLLGCGGAATRIHRTRIGPFRVEDAIAPEALAGLSPQDAAALLAPLDAGVASLPSLAVAAAWVGPLMNGNAVPAGGWTPREASAPPPAPSESGDAPCAAFDEAGRLLAVGVVNAAGQFAPRKVFPAS